MHSSADQDISGFAAAAGAATNEVNILKRKIEMFERILDSIHNGVVVTDPDGIITHFNKPY